MFLFYNIVLDLRSQKIMFVTKNPEYGRQSISRPMRIVAPIPQQGGPRIPKNPIFLTKLKNQPKLKNVQKYAKISDKPFDQRSLIHRRNRVQWFQWFPPCFVRQNQQKKQTVFCAAILDHFQTKMFKCKTTSFHYFSSRILNL